MKKFLYILVLLMSACSAASLVLHRTDVASFIIRTFAGNDLEKKEVLLEYGYVAPGLHKRPFVLNFTGSLQRFSRGTIDLDIINTFTAGNYDKDPQSQISSVSNFLDPTSKFKDSWFGVYVVIDDPAGRAKKFLLNNPAGSPEDLSNLKLASLLKLPHIDQMIVVYSTLRSPMGDIVGKFFPEFPFKAVEDQKDRTETVQDGDGRRWIKVSSQYRTVSALTDIARTEMNELYSIKAYVGLPDKKVYELVDPWHRIIIKGSLLARYFPCANRGFWAVAYFNGSSFSDNRGILHDPWETSDIKSEFEKMFQHLKIGCLR